MVNTRADAREKILKIIRDTDAFRQKQQDEIAFQKRQGYVLTQEKRNQFERAERVQISASKRRLQKLKDEYRTFLENEAQPFSIVDGKIISLSKNNLDFLDALQHMPTLRASALKKYMDYFREENNGAMLQALAAYAAEKGFAVSGIDALLDPDAEYKAFCGLLQKAEKVIDGAPDGSMEEVTLQFFRSEIKESWDDALERNADGTYKHEISVTRKPTTPEEQMQQEFEQQLQNNGDDIQEQVDATRGFLGEEAAAEFLESVALADMQDRKEEKGETAETYAQRAKREREELSKELIEADDGRLAFGSRS